MKLNERLNNLRTRLAVVEAERAGEARAVEALKRIADICRPETQGNTSEGLLAHACIMSLETAECALSEQPALAWLAQQRREAAEAERRANTDVIRSLGPAFCDFFFDGPGDADYLAGVLAQQRSEAAAEALESVRIGWLSDNNYRPGVPEIWRYIANRAAALRAGEVGDD